MITYNNPSLPHLLAALAPHRQQAVSLLDKALLLTMQEPSNYTLLHSGVAQEVTPAGLVAAFHPHVLADALALVCRARGETVPLVQVYTDQWQQVSAVTVTEADVTHYASEYRLVRAAPPPPPAPPVPAAPAAPATLTVPESVLAALAAVEGVTEPAAPAAPQAAPVAEPVPTPTPPAPRAAPAAPVAEPVPVVAQHPVRWHKGVPAPADLAPAPAGGKGRPRLSPFAKAHPLRKRVGQASPFWRDMQPMIGKLFVVGPAETPESNALSQLESFVQLVLLVRRALAPLPDDTTVGTLRDWLDDVYGQIEQSPAWPAIEHAIERYNDPTTTTTQGEGE